jgi:chromosome segregation ATPase
MGNVPMQAVQSFATRKERESRDLIQKFTHEYVTHIPPRELTLIQLLHTFAHLLVEQPDNAHSILIEIEDAAADRPGTCQTMDEEIAALESTVKELKDELEEAEKEKKDGDEVVAGVEASIDLISSAVSSLEKLETKLESLMEEKDGDTSSD